MAVATSTWLGTGRFKARPVSARFEKVKGVLFYYLLALLFVVFLCSIFYIWSRIQIVNLGYSINREITLRDKLQEEHKRLSLEAASLKSPLRLETIAKRDYKMDLPQKSQVLQWVDASTLSSELSQSKVAAVDSVATTSEKNTKEKPELKAQTTKPIAKATVSTKDQKLKQSDVKAKQVAKSAVSEKKSKPSSSSSAKSNSVTAKPSNSGSSVKSTSAKSAVTVSKKASQPLLKLNKKNPNTISIAGNTPQR